MRHEARQGTSETSSKTGDKTGSETGGQDRFCTMDLCSFVDFVEFWWLVRVTLVVDWLFLPQNFWPWWGPTKAFCGSVNVHWVVVLFSGDGTPHHYMY